MNLLNTIIVGFKEIWAHKFRSLLTMLGIILGVASLVAMAALTKGMENGMKETMIAMGGADKVQIDEENVPPEQEHLANEAPGRTMNDVMAQRHLRHGLCARFACVFHPVLHAVCHQVYTLSQTHRFSPLAATANGRGQG